MPNVRVTPDSGQFLAHIREFTEAAAALGDAIAAGRVATVSNDFGSARLVVSSASRSVKPGTQVEAAIAGLLAAGGLSIAWAGDEPTYEIGNLPWARSVLTDVGGSATAVTDNEVLVAVAPDLEAVARAVIQASCRAPFGATEVARRPEASSSLPGIVGLDLQQAAAVNAPSDAFLLVNAAAGSGKTHTLAFRIARLVAECGVPADRCVALTFSVAARVQIRDRLMSLATQGHPQLAEVEVRTLHSLAFRLLVIAAGLGRTRLRRGFAIVEETTTTGDRGGILRAPAPFIDDYETIFADVDDGLARSDRVQLYPAAINALRNGHPTLGVILGPEDLRDDAAVAVVSGRTGQFRDLSPVFLRAVWQRYEAALAQRNGIDLGGLVPEALNVLRSHPALLQFVSSTYSVAFIDEYQDTSLAQDELLFMLAGAGVTLNVVGDGDQTINTFAGARAENIVGFAGRALSRLGREAVTLPLETNYRSRPEIVSLATHLIARNLDRLPKTMRPHDPLLPEEGHVIRVAGELRYIGPWIALQVNALLDSGEEASGIAVLYRKEAETSPQKTAVLDHLRSLGTAVSEDEEDGESVRVITIHRSKGLEFNHVFVLFLGPGDFPDRRGDPEEERRLLYVAITRARRTVYVCGRPGAEPDLFAETDVGDAHPRDLVVDTLVGVLNAADREDLFREFETAAIDDWDEPL